MYFDIPKEQSSIIKVIGVGGGGGNAVNHMFMQGIKDVNFVICNTDAQALEMSPIPNKIQLGPGLTKGRGAGSHPSVGQQATMESLQEIKSLLEKNTEMVFITAGMGGGTGTGGAPVIAKIAKEMGILTIGIVTVPFGFEGKRRKTHATEGLETLKHYVDAILVVSNDKLRDMFGNLAWNEAFAKADDVLTTAAKGIAEIITVPGYVNVDFEDVKTVLRDSGMAIMGSGTATGENRAIDAVKMALESPLLNDNDIRGARNILLNITSGSSAVLMDEIAEITDYVQEAAGNDCDIIWGNCTDETVGEGLTVTVIATGFETMEQRNSRIKQNTFKIMHLDTDHTEAEEKDVATMENVVEEKVMQGEREEQLEDNFEQEDEGITIKVNGETKYEEKKQKKEEDKANPRQFTFDFGMFEQHAEMENEEEELVAEIEETPVMETPITEIISEQIEEVQEEKEEIIFEEEKQEPVFEIKKEVRKPEYPEMKKEEPEEKKREEAPLIQKKVLSGNDDKMHIVQHQNSDRINRLRSMSTKLNSNYDEMEKVPAYLRRNIELEETPDAREINVSKYQVEEGDNGPEIKKNNSFLHDNVD